MYKNIHNPTAINMPVIVITCILCQIYHGFGLRNTLLLV